jgi:uncharacterized repeat protein (TIGR01451 family)
MAADGPLVAGPTATGSAMLNLAGDEVLTGGVVPNDIVSQVSAYELVAQDPDEAAADPTMDSADIRYVGIGSEYLSSGGLDQLYVGIATYRDWNTPNEITFYISLDLDQNGDEDFVVFNSSRLTPAPANDMTDEYVWKFIDVDGNYGAPGGVWSTNAPLNGIPGNVLDTYLQNTNVMAIPVALAFYEDPAIYGTDPAFDYWIDTEGYDFAAAIDRVPDAGVLTYDPSAPTYYFNDLSGLTGGPYSGIPLYNDLDGNAVPVDYDLSAFGTGPYPPVLLFHHHNATAARRAELVQVQLSNGADLQIDKTVSDNTPDEGDTITFTVTLTNNGPVSVPDPVIGDALPAGLTYVTGSQACTPVAGTFTAGTTLEWDFTGNTLLPGATITCTIQATVDTGTNGQTITNTAAITAWNAAVQETSPTNNADAVNVCIGGDPAQCNATAAVPGGFPGLSVFDPAISKIGFLIPGQLGVQGEQLQWIVTVTNTAGAAANNVVVTDTLRNELQVDRVEAPGASVTISGQTVTVTYAVLEAGQSVQFSIFTTSTNGVIVDNTACVTGIGFSGQRCATALPVTRLPSTGETPLWSTMLPTVLILGMTLIVVLLALLKGKRTI